MFEFLKMSDEKFNYLDKKLSDYTQNLQLARKEQEKNTIDIDRALALIGAIEKRLTAIEDHLTSPRDTRFNRHVVASDPDSDSKILHPERNKVIRAYLRGTGSTQTKLARRLHRDPSTVNKWVFNNCSPCNPTWVRFLELPNVERYLPKEGN